jgi:CxxC-x17-CxxC domain-containing protein
MRDFDKGRGDFKKRDFDKPQVMHKTVCSKCGQQCEVPFIPSGSRPVFCRVCFQANRVSNPMRSENNFSASRPATQAQYKEQFDLLGKKLDKILELLQPKVIVPVVPTEKAPKVSKVSKAKKVTKKSTSAKK